MDNQSMSAHLNISDYDLQYLYDNFGTILEHDEKQDAFIRAKFYILAFIIVMGVIFNFLACAVFLQKGIKKTVTVIYFFALACADNVVLIGEILHWLKTQTTSGQYMIGHPVIDTNTHACRLNYFLRYFGRLLSSWLVVSICVERFITVAYPLGLARSSTPRKAKVVILGLVVASFLATSPVFVVFDVRPDEIGQLTCHYFENYQKFYYAWILCVIFIGELLVPSVIVLVFTILIIKKLRKAQLQRMYSKEGQKDVKKDDRKNTQTTIALLAVSIAFVTLRTPYAIMYPIHLYDHNIFADLFQLSTFRIVYNQVMYILVVINYTINFPLYIITGKKFRKEFVNFVLCRGVSMQRRTSRSGSYSFQTKSSTIRRGSNGTILVRQNDSANDKSSSAFQESHL